MRSNEFYLTYRGLIEGLTDEQRNHRSEVVCLRPSKRSMA